MKKKRRQIEFLIPELDGRAVSSKASILAVYREIASLENILLGRFAFNLRLTAMILAWSSNVLIGFTRESSAPLSRAYMMFFFITHRHEDDRDMPIDVHTYPFQDLIAVDIGKDSIKQEHIETVAGNGFDK